MAFSFLLLCLIWESSTGLEGGQDSYMHYLFARYSWDHSHLLLDQWGKPVFTLLSSPFCQLGLKGLVVFNILCLLGSGYFSFAAVKALKFRMPEIAFVIAVFAPIAFGRVISGLTEPLNGFLVALMLYFFAKDKYKVAYVIASFMPFVRTEGFVILGVVLLFLLIKKQYRYLPYVLSGTIFYSIFGAIISGNVMWVIDENPYFKFQSDGVLKLGNGPFLHYVNNLKNLWTVILFVVSIVATFFYSFKWLRNKGDKRYPFLVVLCFGMFFMYLMAHSTIYSLGILGAQGLLRVLMVTIPCFAILCTAFIGGVNVKSFALRQLFFWAISFYVVYSSYVVNDYGFPWQEKVSIPEEHILGNLKNALQFIEENGMEDRMLVHQLPLIDVYANKDPFIPGAQEDAQATNIWGVLSEDDWLKDRHLVLWDGYHAPREGGVSLAFMKKSKRYRFLKKFSDEKSEHFKGHFDIYLFEKKKNVQ